MRRLCCSLLLALAGGCQGLLGIDQDVELVASSIRFAVPAASVIEGVGSTSVEIVVDIGFEVPVSVTVEVVATSSGPDDFSLTGTSVTFAPGERSQQLPIAIVGDGLDEDDEQLELTLVSSTGGELDRFAARHVLTILDDDPPPDVGFTATGNVTFPEMNGMVTFPIQLSEVSGRLVTVPFSTSGTASPGVDFTVATSSPLVFQPGQTAQNIAVVIMDDPIVEPTETVVVTLGAASNAVVDPTASQRTISITNND